MFNMIDKAFDMQNENTVRSSAPAVGRAALILDVVAEATDPPGVSEIARRTGLSKSSAHAVLSALAEEGLVDVVRGGYRLGSRLTALGMRARDQRLHDVAEAILDTLAAATGETAFFGRVEGSKVRILARAVSGRSLRLSAPIGSSVPVLAGALGKAYLSTLPEKDAAAFLAMHPPERYTVDSLIEADVYLDAVRGAKQRGVAMERGEYLSGVVAAAAPIQWSSSTYLLWVVGIGASMDESGLDTLGLKVRDAARTIGHGLQGGTSNLTRSGR
jgi:IclR family transcriptional regulator, KDG regulon repressor